MIEGFGGRGFRDARIGGRNARPAGAATRETPRSSSAEICYLGWRESLTLLAQLVEANATG